MNRKGEKLDCRKGQSGLFSVLFDSMWNFYIPEDQNVFHTTKMKKIRVILFFIFLPRKAFRSPSI